MSQPVELLNGQSITAVAARVEISKSSLHHILNGKRNPSLHTAVKVADALGLTLDELARRIVPHASTTGSTNHTQAA